ncbi:hypothetical protein IH601_04620 [Candidatus Bipolaricaulota bacterium]|nr:hypothetical protein [Candidatus Bipolaricaulota bacterium]
MSRGQAMGWSLSLILLCVSISGFGDRIELHDGMIAYGTVTRVIPGDRVEMVQLDATGTAVTLLSYGLSEIAEVVVIDMAKIPSSLMLQSGDQFQGRLMSSPLESKIEFQSDSGGIYTFDAASVKEVMFSLRPADLLEEAPSLTAAPGLSPGIGLGCSISPVSFGVTSDALAVFSEKWMLIAALGMHLDWEDPDRWGIGVSSDLTYLRQFEGWYAGLGTGVFFDMTDIVWNPTVNIRVLIPFTLGEWQSTISLGYVIRL